jgi:hypothetical protein
MGRLFEFSGFHEPIEVTAADSGSVKHLIEAKGSDAAVRLLRVLLDVVLHDVSLEALRHHLKVLDQGHPAGRSRRYGKSLKYFCTVRTQRPSRAAMAVATPRFPQVD